jgi:AcrR family transcriptional regulator
MQRHGHQAEQGHQAQPAQPKQPEQRTRVRRRRKDARPDEILDAAVQEFAEHGYGAARLEAIARRAGIAKGTIYLYFPGKEELFKAAVRRAVFPMVESVRTLVQASTASTEDFLRGPFKELQLRLLTSDARHLARILITEGRASPALTEFYAREVVERGLETLHMMVARGVARGEFRQSKLDRFPQPLFAAAVLALMWDAVLGRHRPLDVEGLLDTHLDLIIEGLKVRHRP